MRDAALGTDLPSFVTNSTNYNASIPFVNQTIFWNEFPEGWDGFALLVDDVERYVGTALNYSLSALDPDLIHFFRLAVSYALPWAVKAPLRFAWDALLIPCRSSRVPALPGTSRRPQHCTRTAPGLILYRDHHRRSPVFASLP